MALAQDGSVNRPFFGPACGAKFNVPHKSVDYCVHMCATWLHIRTITLIDAVRKEDE